MESALHSSSADTVRWSWTSATDSGTVVLLVSPCPCDDPTGVSVITSRAFGLRVTNPARERMDVSFDVDVRDHVRLSVHDVTGRLLRELRNGELDAGTYAVSVRIGRADDAIAPGRVVLLRLETSSRTLSRKVVLLR